MYYVAILLVVCAFAQGAESGDAMKAFLAADYRTAIPLLEAAVAKDPKDVQARAALLSALVYENRQEEAAEADRAGQADFPGSAEMLTARGEYAFYMGDIGAAEKLWRQSIGLKEDGRTIYDLARLNMAASRSGRPGC